MSETVTTAQIDAATSAVAEALRFADMCHRSFLGEHQTTHSDAANSILVDLNSLPEAQRLRIVADLKKRQADPEFQKYLADLNADNLVCVANELHHRLKAVRDSYTGAVADLIRPWKNKTRKTAHSVAVQYVSGLCEVFRRACRNGFTREEMLRVGSALVADIHEFPTVKKPTIVKEYLHAESQQAKRKVEKKDRPPPSKTSLQRSNNGHEKFTIEQRMKLVLFDKPESAGWTISEFQTELECSRGGVHKTATWQALEAARKLGKTERRKDRRRRTKPR